MTAKEYICTAPKEHTMNCGWTLGGRAEYWMCQNTKSCPAEDFVGNKEIWQALIDGKAAQDALQLALAALEIIESGKLDWNDLVIMAGKTLGGITLLKSKKATMDIFGSCYIQAHETWASK